MKDYLIIYHKEDNDGVVACAILCDYLNKQGKTYDIWGANYRDTMNLGNGAITINDIPFDSLSLNYKNLMITDVSFNNEKHMQKLYEMFGREHFFWVDHHEAIMKSADDKPFGDSLGIRDASHSALYNMWMFLYGFMGVCEVPHSIELLSAYDSFTYNLWNIPFEECYDYNRGFTFTFKLSVESVVKYIEIGGFNDDNNITNISLTGHILNENELNVGNKLIKDCGEFGWTVAGERSAMMVVYSYSTNTIMFSGVKDKVQNVIVIKRGNGGNWYCSLYNTDPNDKFNCGDYLKKTYKGGGHIGAAGAEFTERKFNKIMKTKNL